MFSETGGSSSSRSGLGNTLSMRVEKRSRQEEERKAEAGWVKGGIVVDPPRLKSWGPKLKNRRSKLKSRRLRRGARLSTEPVFARALVGGEPGHQGRGAVDIGAPMRSARGPRPRSHRRRRRWVALRIR